MIYFDNSATTPMLPDIIQTIQKVQQTYIGNPSSLHKLGVQARTLLNKAREQIADLLHVATDEIYFTSGGTESNNTAILGTAFEKYGKHLITSQIEHPATLKTMQFLEKMGYDITYLPVSKDGLVSAIDVKNALREDTILVSIMWVNNEVGTVQPIEEIGKVLQDYPNIHFHVDAVQAVEVLLEQGVPARVDLLSLSAHKFHGPRGTGILYKKNGRRVQPLLHGGGQEQGLRSSTENVANSVGTAKALRLQQEMIGCVEQLNKELREFLSGFEKVIVLSPEHSARHILTFAIAGIRGEVVVHALEEHDIYISTTSACSSRANQEHHTLGAMGVPKTVSQCAVRISFSQYNTVAELETFKKVFQQVYQQFQKTMKK